MLKPFENINITGTDADAEARRMEVMELIRMTLARLTYKFHKDPRYLYPFYEKDINDVITAGFLAMGNRLPGGTVAGDHMRSVVRSQGIEAGQKLIGRAKIMESIIAQDLEEEARVKELNDTLESMSMDDIKEVVNLSVG